MNIAITDNRKSRVRYDDLREWIAEADKLGELVRANGYSWQEDIGMAAELLQHEPKRLWRCSTIFPATRKVFAC